MSSPSRPTLDPVGQPWRGTSLELLAAAHWPAAAGDEAPAPVPGFILSDFAPLVVDVAERCLRAHFRDPAAVGDRAERTAVVLVSVAGDVATASAIADAVDSGARVSGLLFFQSVPNSVLGWVASRWGLGGPVVCTSPAGDPLEEAATVAELLVLDDAADDVLAVLVEPANGDESSGRASAFLLRREVGRGARPRPDPGHPLPADAGDKHATRSPGPGHESDPAPRRPEAPVRHVAR